MAKHAAAYHLAPNYTRLTIWSFDARTRQRTSTIVSVPFKGQTRHDRYEVAKEALEALKLPVPAYIPTAGEKKASTRLAAGEGQDQ